MSDRVKVLSVTLKDCEVQTFRSGGPGGQNQNKVSSGVRIIHTESGARGESRETRSQLENKKRAFRRMVESKEFQLWMKLKLGAADAQKAESDRRVRNQVERDMRPENILIETYIPEGERVSDGTRS